VQLAQQAQPAQVEHCQTTLPNARHQFESLLPSRSSSIVPMPVLGVLLCLASAVAFGAMGVLGKLAYAHGATVGTLLSVRFVLAATILWLVVAGTGGLPRLRAVPSRDLAAALGLGAVGYGAQAGGYFTALQRLDASLVALLVYTFPAMVAAGAVALGRERVRWRTVSVLAATSTGLVLVLAGAGAGALEPLGIALALATAAVYSVYVLASEGVADRLGALTLATLVCTGAAVTLTLAAGLAGDLAPTAVDAAGLAALAALAVGSTVLAIALFLAGLRRVGATAAAILSTVEPVVAIALAGLAFGEALTPAQLVGAGLVLAAALTVRAPEGGRLTRRRIVLTPAHQEGT